MLLHCSSNTGDAHSAKLAQHRAHPWSLRHRTLQAPRDGFLQKAQHLAKRLALLCGGGDEPRQAARGGGCRRLQRCLRRLEKGERNTMTRRSRSSTFHDSDSACRSTGGACEQAGITGRFESASRQLSYGARVTTAAHPVAEPGVRARVRPQGVRPHAQQLPDAARVAAERSEEERRAAPLHLGGRSRGAGI